jgi:hypothetical protein
MSIDYGTEVTHVLAWLPPYLIAGSRTGWWDLHTLAAYEAGEPPAEWAQGLDDNRDAEECCLEDWVQDRLGYPVTLEKGEVEIRPRRSLRWHREPVYYVRRAS